MALNVGNADVQIGTSATNIVNGGLGQSITILKATATNTDTAIRSLTLYRVPNGGSVGAAYIIGADTYQIGAGETVVLPLSGQTLIAQQSLQGVASVAAVVNLNLSYASTP